MTGRPPCPRGAGLPRPPRPVLGDLRPLALAWATSRTGDQGFSCVVPGGLRQRPGREPRPRHGRMLPAGRLQQGNSFRFRRVTARAETLGQEPPLKEDVAMHNPVPTVIRPLLRFARSARLIAPLIVAVAFVAGITTACSSATASSPSHATGGRARQ